MKYQLINKDIEGKSLLDIIYENRNLTKEQVEKLLNADERYYQDAFGIYGMKKAVEQFNEEITKENNILIICDSDCDGNCSSAIFYKFLIEDIKYNKEKVFFYIHEGKQHGITKKVFKYIKDINAKYLIVPDAGTNNIEEMKKLNKLDVKVLCLDHHLVEINLNKIPSNTVIVNNQVNNISKCGSGTFVTAKFIEALGYSIDKYKDLIAISLIADSMDCMDKENRAFINEGLNNIKNPLVKEYFKKNRIYKPIINDVSYNLANFVNATIRVGTQEEKELMFRAFIGEQEEFNYIKRGGEEVKETLQERVVRLSSNAKSRQNNATKKSVEKCNAYITRNHLDNDKVIIIKNDNGFIDKDTTGLVAMKVADSWKRPCIILNKSTDGLYSGSARAIGEINNLKDILDETELCEWNKGHQGAFGVLIKEINIEELRNKLNERLKDFEFYDGRIYTVDNVIDIKDLSKNDIKEIGELNSLWCSTCKSPLFCIKNIEIESCKIEMKGKLRMEFKYNGFKFVKNWCSKDFFEMITCKQQLKFGRSIPLNITLICKFLVDSKGNPFIEIIDANSIKSSKLNF